ncbi:hypothetical protein B1M_11755, partial [Burkholderia sp. TJI49]
ITTLAWPFPAASEIVAATASAHAFHFPACRVILILE